MNINHEIVARAMNKAGQEPLTDQEWNDQKNTRYRLIHQFYLETILETLAQTDWTSQKKRAKLNISEEENISTWQYMYDLPLDCSKCVSLNSEYDFNIEDGYLYTEDPAAILLYISNHARGDYAYEKADPQPSSIQVTDQYYYFDKDLNRYVRATTYDATTEYYVRLEEDYNFYDDFNPDPLLSEYIETKLASKIVLKLSGDTQLYQLLYSEAQIMENKAVKASEAHSKNKERGNRYWSDILGLPDYEEI